MLRRNRSRTWLGLALILSACSAPPPAPQTQPSPSSSPPPVSVPDSLPTGDDEAPLTSPPPVAAAAPVAAGFAAAWVNATADSDSWWAALRPWCDDGLAASLRSTDPANVPARQVTGPPTPVSGSAAEGLRIQIPTDAGRLLLTVAAIDGHWRVSEVDFARSSS